jgi:lipopolysaccharide exporter
MGRYAVATDLASSPSAEINAPMVAVLYPVMSKVRSDVPALRRLYLNTFGWSAIICLSTAVGVTMVAHDLVHLVLGEKWLSVEPLIGWLALGTGMLGLSSGAYVTFDAIGKPDLGAKMQWTRLIFLTVALVPICMILRNMSAVAIGRAGMIAIFIPTLLFTIGRQIKVSPKDYAGALFRPVMAACVMALVLRLTNIWLSPGNGRLLFDVVLGVVTFGGSLLFAWVLSGKPQGPEKDIYVAIPGLFNKVRKRGLKLFGRPVGRSSNP